MSAPETLRLDIVRWEGQIRCVYLDDTRIAGGKPWGGGDIIASFKVDPADLDRILAGFQRRSAKP